MTPDFVDAPVAEPDAECWHREDDENTLEILDTYIEGRMLYQQLECTECGAELVLDMALTRADRGRCLAVTDKGHRCPNGAAFESVHQLCGLHKLSDEVRLVEEVDDER